jgi:hypothetical protein
MVARMTSINLRTYLLIASWPLLLSSCIWDSHSYPRSKPYQGDLVGTWLPDAKTIDDMRIRGGYVVSQAKTRIVLNEDGTFEAIDMPDWWNDGFGSSRRALQYRSGTWKLIPHANERGWGINLDMVSPFGNEALNLLGSEAPYRIYIIIGDPDQDHAMIFQKPSRAITEK